jgi:hypothetical protein
MSTTLQDLFIERISTGLKRVSIKSPSKWAETYRIMGKPIPGKWTFKYHPWLKEMHDTKASINVGKKSAQVGFSEMALNTVFYKIDVEGENCLYILPAKNPDATDFSASRFDPALELSEHLEGIFSDVKNVGHKRAGNANLYIRGSNSRAGLKSVPSGILIFDEYDEMNQENIPLARERASGQFTKLEWDISTPTAPDFGIAKAYKQSSQERFFFNCPSCSRFTEFTFPECLIITADKLHDPSIENSHLICKECKNKIVHEMKWEFLQSGQWIPQVTDRITRGFYINQLYSSTVSPVEIAKKYFEAQIDKTSEQEFWNSKMGMEHLVEGARVDDIEIENCISEFRKFQSKTNGLITMGVDVGKWFHVEIDEWELGQGNLNLDVNINARPRVIWEGKVLNATDLDDLFKKYSVRFCVIDAQPERRAAFDFAIRFWGHVKLCFYGRSITGKQIKANMEDNDETIQVDRTSWLDLSLGRFHRGKNGILLPIDVSMEYREQIKAPVRRYEKDAQGNYVGRYLEVGPDHFAHARNYAEIALPLSLGLGVSKNMQSVY